MDKECYPPLYWASDFLSKVWLKLINVVNRFPENSIDSAECGQKSIEPGEAHN